jgi:hypothetical protein
MKNVGKLSILFWKKMFTRNRFQSLALLFVLFSVGCVNYNTVSVAPACSQTMACNIDIPTSYLGLCSRFFEGNTHDMRIEVVVDGFSFNGTNVQTTLKDKFTFNRTNNLTGATLTLPIRLPECGSYQVTITVRGKDNTCFKCCSNNSALALNAQCVFPAKGIINYRAVSVKINADASNPPPSILNLEPVPIDCTDCGC